MEESIRAIASSLNGDPSAVPADSPTGSFVSRILQVALGLFVTTMELPPLSPELGATPSLGFDCDFSLPCRWSSFGGTTDKWRMAKGEPDSILWLAATGTMVQPAEPFALLEVREGRTAEMLCSDSINCQESSSLLSFTYWTIGNSDLEICLLDTEYRRFNCTGMLQTHVQPGKVALKIPPVRQRGFHIAIIPSRGQGVLVVDEIKYDARYCLEGTQSPAPTAQTLSTFPTWVPRSAQTKDPDPPATVPPDQHTTDPSARPSAPTGPVTSPPSVFVSPSASSGPSGGPLSTASPLPNPFTIGPSLPMGPLILPPLLPGPPSGIVNPFVVAPMIPAATTVDLWSYTTPDSASPDGPPVIIVTANPKATATTPTERSTTTTTTTTTRMEMETTTSEKMEESKELASAATRRTIPPDLFRFTPTVIAPRTRPVQHTEPPVTVTRLTRMPFRTGIPNIPFHQTTTVRPLPSFDLLIVGNKTRPFFDRRLGKVTDQAEDLLCDFTHNFPCLWGPEAGRWAIVQEGAIPSLDRELDSEEEEAPQYPAAVVIQGTAMLSSDPLKCQSGEGKLLFRYWTNGRVLIQVCAMGWAQDSAKIQCVEEVAHHNRMDPNSLAIFELPDPIREPFTLNVVPIWDKHAHNNYLLIDEIAYIGECNLTALNQINEIEEREHSGGIVGGGAAIGMPWGITARPGARIVTTPTPRTYTRTFSTAKSTASTTEATTTMTTKGEKKTTTTSVSTEAPAMERSTTTTKATTTVVTTSKEEESEETEKTTRRPPSSARTHRPTPPTTRSPPHLRTRRPLPVNPLVNPSPRRPPPQSRVHPTTADYYSTTPPFWWFNTTRRPGTRYPFFPNTPTPPHGGWKKTSPFTPTPNPVDFIMTSTHETAFTVDNSGEEPNGGGGVITIYPGIAPLKKKNQKTLSTKSSFTIPYTTSQKYGPTTPSPELNYCKLLNCDFNENACHYLNHGLTKVPWTLRTRGYGFPLSRHTDLRPTTTNAQFVSTVLGPGDFAILESPRFNLTEGINVLLFQYYRPTHSSTIRLCLGTRYTKPLRTVAAFLQCPPILRSITSKSAPKWNSVHIQLPPGTSHFYLVAHNLDRSADKTAIAIDNIRVAICDPRVTYVHEEPDYADETSDKASQPTNTAAPVESFEVYEGVAGQ